MITTTEGSAKSEAAMRAERLQEESKATIGKLEPLKRQPTGEAIAAVALDAARLALNLGALSEQIAQDARESYEVWRAGKRVSELLLEGQELNERLERELAEARAELLEVTNALERDQDALRRSQSEARSAASSVSHWSGRCRELEVEVRDLREATETQARNHAAVLGDLAAAENEREAYKATLATQRSTDAALRMSVADRLMMPQDSDWSQLLPLIGKR